MSHVVRRECPSNNPYYIRQVNGGYNGAVQGSPTKGDANVLANCVGYSNGRFNEIIHEETGYNGCKYQLVCDAENFIERAQEQGLEISSTPTVGAIMVWGKGSIHSSDDGAGHVAIVEEVIDGNTVYTSESGYKSFYFANMTRNNNNGNWGLSSPYWFRGFVVNPAVKSEPVLMDIRNWDLYYWCYEDLRREIGYSGPGLARHWDEFGANEGRIASYVFDPIYYAEHNPDVVQVYGGNNYKGMFNHFIDFGIDEGRAGNICLNINYYKENNPDLQGMTNKELVNHFIQFGINEINRPCSPDFSIKAYRNKNPDLAKAFGYKSAKLYKHWWMYGRFENRKHNWGTPKK